MPQIPAGEWIPDQPALGNPGAPSLENLIPTGPGTYGPFRRLGTQLAAQLGGTCIGAAAFEDLNGAPRLFAATDSKLLMSPAIGFEPFAPAGPWGDQTPGAGMVASPATALEHGRWRFGRWNTTLIAVNQDNRTQAIQLDPDSLAGQFDDLAAFVAGPPATGAPSARYIACTNSGFVILGFVRFPPANVAGQTPVTYRNRLWWGAFADPTSWPTPGGQAAVALESSFVDLTGSQGVIQGLVPDLAGYDCVVWLERGIVRLLYTGGRSVFDQRPVVGEHGTPAPDSIVKIGNIAYYLSNDGFRAFDGGNASPIGAGKVDSWFAANVPPQYINATLGVPDFPNKCVRWLIGIGDVFDAQLVYSWAYNRWTMGRLPASFGTAVVQPPGRHLAAAVFNIHNIPGLMDGQTLAAQIATAETNIFPNRRSFVRGVRPLIDSVSPTIQVAYREAETEPQLFGNTVAQDPSGTCPQRIDSWFVQASLRVPAQSEWSELIGFDIDVIPSGMRPIIPRLMPKVPQPGPGPGQVPVPPGPQPVVTGNFILDVSILDGPDVLA